MAFRSVEQPSTAEASMSINTDEELAPSLNHLIDESARSFCIAWGLTAGVERLLGKSIRRIAKAAATIARREGMLEAAKWHDKRAAHYGFLASVRLKHETEHAIEARYESAAFHRASASDIRARAAAIFPEGDN